MALESVEEFYDFVRYSRGLHTRIRNPSKKKTGPPKKNTSLPLLEKQHHRLQGAAATACAPRSYRITGNHLGMNTFHGPPKPTFLEVFMVNNLVFRWPKPVFFMVLGAHGFVVPPPNPKKTGEIFWCHLTPEISVESNFQEDVCIIALPKSSKSENNIAPHSSWIAEVPLKLPAILCQLSPTKGQSFMKQTDNLNQKNRRP